MDAQTHILASSSQRVYFNSVSPGSTGALRWEFPAHNPQYGAWADKVLFVVQLTAIGGAPTAWSLGLKFQYELPHTDQEQYIAPTWADLDTTTVTSDIFEGAPWSTTKRSGDTGADPADGGYGVVATDAAALPFTIKRTITNFGRGVRVLADPFATGGTAPYLNATILAIPSSGS